MCSAQDCTACKVGLPSVMGAVWVVVSMPCLPDLSTAGSVSPIPSNGTFHGGRGEAIRIS